MGQVHDLRAIGDLEVEKEYIEQVRDRFTPEEMQYINLVESAHKQLEKLIDVLEVTELAPEDSVCRELALIKVAADAGARSEIVSIAGIFRANIIDVSQTTLTVEMTGDQNKIEAFRQLLVPYGIKEIVRTGLSGIQRGASTLYRAKEDD